MKSKRIGIWTGPAWELWDLDSPSTTGIGGSETCAIQLARVAASRGHEVIMFGEHSAAEQDGIRLVPYREFEPQVQQFDLFVASRSLSPITSDLRAGKVLVWVHDTCLLSGQDVSEEQRSYVDRFVCLSPWHARYFAQYHGLDETEIIVIPNGVGEEFLQPPDLSQKVFGRLMWSSNPNRGLSTLLQMLPRWQQKIPELHVEIYYGFQTWEAIARRNNDTDGLRAINSLRDQIASMPGVQFYDRVSQHELAQAWQRAYLWCYPTDYHETYCLSAKEAQASAVPIVCSNLAALESTVGAAGLRISGDTRLPEIQSQYEKAVVALCRDREVWEEYSRLSFEGAARCDWPARWDDDWKNQIFL